MHETRHRAACMQRCALGRSSWPNLGSRHDRRVEAGQDIDERVSEHPSELSPVTTGKGSSSWLASSYRDGLAPASCTAA